MDKIWKNFIKTLIYVFTPVFIFYCICFVIATFTQNGLLWNWLEIPANLLELSIDVTNIGMIPAVGTMVLILINLGNIAFKTNTQNKKNNLNMAVLEEKQNQLLNNQKVILTTLNRLANNVITMDDLEKEQINTDITTAVNKIDRSLSNNIDFENLDIESIKKQLLALKDMSKGISALIKK
jgi:cbb3-type cytochrome oxidase subunit 3